MAPKGKLFVVSAPSGAGKTSVVSEALKRLQKDFDISRTITHTSRLPREGEVDGKDYVFHAKEDFEQKLKDGFFLEFTEYADKLYGSPASILSDLERGKSFISVLDIVGAKSISKAYPDACCIWIETKDIDTLRNRLLKRGTETECQIDERLKVAEQEMKEAHNLQRLFTYRLINEDFEQAVRELIMIIKRELS